MPLATTEQRPSLPATLQASQEPEHAVLQQNPSMQNVDEHCAARVQQAPLFWGGTHWPAQLQMLPAAQSVSAEQVLGQLAEAPPQR